MFFGRLNKFDGSIKLYSHATRAQENGKSPRLLIQLKEAELFQEDVRWEESETSYKIMELDCYFAVCFYWLNHILLGFIASHIASAAHAQIDEIKIAKQITNC